MDPFSLREQGSIWRDYELGEVSAADTAGAAGEDFHAGTSIPTRSR
jgi:hypothetical protein